MSWFPPAAAWAVVANWTRATARAIYGTAARVEVVLSHGGPLNLDVLTPPGRGERRVRPARARGQDLDALIQHLVRTGIQTVPADEGTLYHRLVRGVERELLEQVLQLCDNVLVKAAARLGINRNTLHKKLNDFNMLDKPEKLAE